MPLQRRLPKGGFHSRMGTYYDEIRLHELNRLEDEVVDLAALKAAGLIRKEIKTVKIIASGKLEKKVSTKGLRVTKGARAAIEEAGGNID